MTTPSTPSHETIAHRAYLAWEQNGRPEGRAEEFWHQAERELRAGSESDRQQADSDPIHRDEGPKISNLDRALPPNERRKARTQRRSASSTPAARTTKNGPAADAEHYIVLLDRAHMRIYRADAAGPAQTGVPQLVSALDEPAGRQSYVANDSDSAGQFPGARKSRRTTGTPGAAHATAAGGTNDERLPMKEERDRRLAQDWAGRIAAFLAEHPGASWDYAAAPAMHRAVLDQLDDDARRRLRTAVQKDLIHQPATDLREHFADESTAAR